MTVYSTKTNNNSTQSIHVQGSGSSSTDSHYPRRASFLLCANEACIKPLDHHRLTISKHGFLTLYVLVWGKCSFSLWIILIEKSASKEKKCFPNCVLHLQFNFINANYQHKLNRNGFADTTYVKLNLGEFPCCFISCTAYKYK